jgi:anti-anti-sigma factor
VGVKYEPLEDVLVEHVGARKAVARFGGEHDLSERDRIERLLRALLEDNDLVVADFSEATFVDSTIMHLLLEADMTARRQGNRFRLQLGTDAIVARAFELTGLGQRLEIAWSREEALGEQTRD